MIHNFIMSLKLAWQQVDMHSTTYSVLNHYNYLIPTSVVITICSEIHRLITHLVTHFWKNSKTSHISTLLLEILTVLFQPLVYLSITRLPLAVDLRHLLSWSGNHTTSVPMVSGQFTEKKEWPMLSQRSVCGPWSSRGPMFVRVKKWTETRW